METNTKNLEARSAWQRNLGIGRFTGLEHIGILIALLVCALIVNGQSGGSSRAKSKDTGGAADQNLKSLAHVNPSTLAMEMNIPLFSYPGRNGNSLPIGLSYSSKLWRMDNRSTYFYFTPIGHYKQYVTQLAPMFAERSAAGWTSSLAAPTIEEKFEIYNQEGEVFTPGEDINGFNFYTQQAATAGQGSGLLSNPNLPCGWVCIERTRTCENGVCDPWECTRFDWNTANCGGGGPGGGASCHYQNGYCPASCSFCVEEPQCPSWHPNCDIDIEPPPGIENPPKMHYVKRVNVRMGDGSTHEFRKSDAVFGYCSGSVNDGPDCEGVFGVPDTLGKFLAVDGSGMTLVRTSDGSTLHMTDGSRYQFPGQSTGSFDQTALFEAKELVDIDGNRTVYSTSETPNQFTVDGQNVRKVKDTVGREFEVPLPLNLIGQSQIEGDQVIGLSSLSGSSSLDYKLKWRHLKPVQCTNEVLTNCGQTEGALEHPEQNIYYYTSITCFGSAENPVNSANPNTTEKLFPLNGIGMRSCNPFDGDTPATALAKRFNPVVLAGVDLPNGQKYEFRYNQYGEITKIVYPTGSFETFQYGQIAPMNGFDYPAYDQTNRGVVERNVFQANSTVPDQHWTYAVAFTGSGANANYKVTMTSSKGNSSSTAGAKTERYLLSDTAHEHQFGFDKPSAGMPVDERSFDENNVLRSRTLTEWTVHGPVATNDPIRPANSLAQRDPQVARTVSVIIENGQALATLSENEYETPGVNNNTAPTDAEYFAHLNLKRTKSHHFRNIPLSLAQTGTFSQIAGYFNSSTIATIGETDYAYIPDYKARGINSLPTESRALDKEGNVLTKTQTLFDEQNYLGASSGYLSGNLVSTWTDPSTDLSIPANSRLLRGKPTTTKLWNNETNSWISSCVQYDQYGSPRKAWEPNEDYNSSRFTETEYSSDYGFAYPTKVTTPPPDPTNTHGTNSGSFITTSYDFMTGLPLTVSNEFGQTTKTEYNDALLRPTKVYGLSDFTIPIAETIYDDIARTVKVRKQLDSMNWDESTTYADSMGRSVKTVANDSQGDVIVETKYDLLGRVQMVSNPYRQGDLVLWSLKEYDEAGRVKQTREPVAGQNPSSPTGNILGTSGFDISTAPDALGTVITTTNAASKKSRSISNALGQLIAVDEPDSTGALPALPQSTPVPSPTPSGTPSPHGQCISQCPPNFTGGEYPSYSTFYDYNSQGKLVKVTQGDQKRFFLYDSLGRLIRVRQPEQEINASLERLDPFTGNKDWTAGFTYDLLGNVLTATDAKGIVTHNEYDRGNRLTRRYYTGEPSGQTTPEVTFWYDGKGLASQQSPNYATGKLTKVTSSVSETENSLFDKFGQITKSSQITDGNTYTSKYTYNLSGAVVEEEYPSGRKVKNDFESDGDASRIYGRADANSPERTYAKSFQYTADGKIESLQLGNDLWEKARFNTRMQPTEIALGHGPNSGDLWKLGYEYGELNVSGSVDTSKNTGNIARQTVSFNGLAQPFVQSYKYDSLSRLTEARETKNGSQTWTQQFGYDRYGNRISTAQTVNALNITTTPAVDPNTNRFTSTSFHYDKNGNVTQDIDPITSQVRSAVFNGDNKQTEVKDANGNSIGKYYFDGEGKRVKKVTYLETAIYVYSGGKLVAEYSTAAPSQNPTTTYTATDLLGSPRILTDSLGNVISRRDFLPFGEEIYADGTNRTTNAKYSQTGQDGVRKRFTGYEKDNETGLDFAEARMYENRYGRFTAVDPLLASGKSVNPQTFNRYAYVLNSPLIFTDPDGLQTGFASGKVYINSAGNQVRIFPGKPRPGFKELTYDISTTTRIRGVAHHMDVTPNGWTIGNRVDGKTFERRAPERKSATPVENGAIRALSTGVSNGVDDALTGIPKGIGNAPAVGLNGLTFLAANSGPALFYFRGSNPFAVPMIFPYANPREASYGSAGSTAALMAPGVVTGVFGRASSLPSVVPGNAVTNPVPSTLARVIPGEGNFSTLGRPSESRVFVTAAEDIAGINNASDMATRLGVYPSGRFTIIEFPAPQTGIASPISGGNEFFVGFGRTSGGAREFTIPNGPIPCNATIRTIC